MKYARIFALLLAAALCLGLLTACGSEEGNGQTEPTAALPVAKTPTGEMPSAELTQPTQSGQETAPEETAGGEEEGETGETRSTPDASTAGSSAPDPAPVTSEETSTQSDVPIGDDSQEDLDDMKYKDSDEDLH